MSSNGNHRYWVRLPHQTQSLISSARPEYTINHLYRNQFEQLYFGFIWEDFVWIGNYQFAQLYFCFISVLYPDWSEKILFHFKRFVSGWIWTNSSNCFFFIWEDLYPDGSESIWTIVISLPFWSICSRMDQQ